MTMVSGSSHETGDPMRVSPARFDRLCYQFPRQDGVQAEMRGAMRACGLGADQEQPRSRPGLPKGQRSPTGHGHRARPFLHAREGEQSGRKPLLEALVGGLLLQLGVGT